MNLSDLNNLDIKNIATAPAPARALVIVLILAAVLAAGWFLVWSEALTTLDRSKAEEQGLRESYAIKKAQARHYEAYKLRLAEIEQSLDSLLRQLPNRSQMDALLTDINQAGVGRGLEFDLFRPGGETMAEFYAMLPVAIKVVGNYHDIGGFLNDLALLPRIVSVHDIVLTPARDSALAMEARIQTYRYLDEDELATIRRQKLTQQQGAVKK